MADLKTFWDNPVTSSQDLSSDLATSSGSDPEVTITGENACDPLWADSPVPTLSSGAESDNSVSGLPSLPDRFAPSDQPPEPPELKDRRPGTIDSK